MSVPLRKDEFDDGELTTADLAQTKRPVASPVTSEARTGPILAERSTLEPTGTQDTTETREPAEAEQLALTETSARVDTLRNDPVTQKALDATPLFPAAELDGLRNRWNEVQAAFVDEPRRAVEQADGLVASAMKRLAEVFAEERAKLEQQWDRGDNVSTEELRVALQRYRSFFHRLLAI
jgi:hypothetical protein